jgi:hypothetical protein
VTGRIGSCFASKCRPVYAVIGEAEASQPFANRVVYANGPGENFVVLIKQALLFCKKAAKNFF